jgi:hypothetical protein
VEPGRRSVGCAREEIQQVVFDEALPRHSAII